MKIGIEAAKSRLSELIGRVLSGEDVLITRHGVPVAKLVLASQIASIDHSRVVKRIRALRRRLDIRARVPLRKLITEGRD